MRTRLGAPHEEASVEWSWRPFLWAAPASRLRNYGVLRLRGPLGACNSRLRGISAGKLVRRWQQPIIGCDGLGDDPRSCTARSGSIPTAAREGGPRNLLGRLPRSRARVCLCFAIGACTRPAPGLPTRPDQRELWRRWQRSIGTGACPRRRTLLQVARRDSSWGQREPPLRQAYVDAATAATTGQKQALASASPFQPSDAARREYRRTP